MNIIQVPLNELYQLGPEGRIFGRQFDLALISWQTDGEFDCSLFKSDEIPTDANYWLGKTTGGTNFFGYTSDVYDQACAVREQAGLDHAAGNQADADALRIINQDVPLIPIYYHPDAYLVKNDVCGISENYLTFSDFLVDLQDILIEPNCIDEEQE